MNQTAHISLQILSISKSVETKETEMRPVLLARPASFTSDFLLRLVAVLCLSGPSGVPFMHRCVSGEALFTVSVPNLQPLFLRNMHFLRQSLIIALNQAFACAKCRKTGVLDSIVALTIGQPFSRFP